MSEAATTQPPTAQNRTALLSCVLGPLAVVFLLLGSLNDAFYLPGDVAGVAALVSGIVALRRVRAGAPRRRAAIAGTLLGSLLVAWFGILGLLVVLGVFSG